MGMTIKRNLERNGIEIHFFSKPTDEVRSYLKSHGWRWSSYSFCWYHYYSTYNMEIAQYIYDTYYEKSTEKSYQSNTANSRLRYQNLAKHKITGDSFIIKGNAFQKKQLENLEEVCAIFYVVQFDGQIQTVCAPAFHIINTSDYYIFNDDFSQVENYGTPLCKRIEYEKYRQSNSDYSFNNLSEKSLLALLGYTANSKSNLSDFQRRSILKYAMDNNIMEKARILSFLSWLIKERSYNHNFSNAIEKWSLDRSWVSQYKLLGKNVVFPDVTVKTKYIAC